MDSKSKKLVSLFVASLLVIPSVGCSPQDDDEDEGSGSRSGYHGGYYGGSGGSGSDKDANYKRGIGLKSGGSSG